MNGLSKMFNINISLFRFLTLIKFQENHEHILSYQRSRVTQEGSICGHGAPRYLSGVQGHKKVDIRDYPFGPKDATTRPEKV